MPRVDLLTTSGKKVGTTDLPKEIFAAKINPTLMAQAVRVFLSNQRQAKAKAKTRAEVKGSGRKIWRQKGTGRARHGDRYAPIFVGGGVAHGPTGKENYQLKISKPMKRKALFSALTTQFKEGHILVVKGFEKVDPKTKAMAKILSALKIGEEKTLLVLPKILTNALRAGRNLPRLSLIQASLLNPYQVLVHRQIIFLPESIEQLKAVFLKK